jgi:Fe-S cluster biosynthesis and repair protein YggX
MMDTQSRIEQFQKMAEADPDNELGHFSLGRAYLENDSAGAAAPCFLRVLQLNPGNSRAYQYLAMALLKTGQRERGVEELTKGFKVALERGDVLPRKEMAKMLEELGTPVPEVGRAEPERPLGSGEVLCHRCNRVGPRMANPPFSKPIGKEIQEKVCMTCWREWIGMGTKVINELRLPMSDPQAQKVFDAQMMEFLNLR